MTLTRLLGWILFALSVGGCLYMLWTFGWLIFYPVIDPLPVVVGIFFRLVPLFLAIILVGICYVICRLLRI